MSVMKLASALGALVLCGTAAEAQNLKLDNRNDQFTITVTSASELALYRGSTVRDGDTYATMLICVRQLENSNSITVEVPRGTLDIAEGHCGVVSGHTISIRARSAQGDMRLVVRTIGSGWGFDGPNRFAPSDPTGATGN